MYKGMIVEDNVTNYYRRVLKKWNFEFMIGEAFDQVDKLVDSNLPSFDSFYWCERIRKFSDVLIIFISSRDGCPRDDLIQEPFSLEF
ncbi:hypothetical protein ABEV54_10870 [Peribacillus psychrosaccharolyticus]|uniref:hypothetical protein n=1 Tax=Peribacillus psychrosaccharolyticus TaxID=1407 RepID=UPI003D29A035